MRVIRKKPKPYGKTDKNEEELKMPYKIQRIYLLNERTTIMRRSKPYGETNYKQSSIEETNAKGLKLERND